VDLQGGKISWIRFGQGLLYPLRKGFLYLVLLWIVLQDVAQLRAFQRLTRNSG